MAVFRRSISEATTCRLVHAGDAGQEGGDEVGARVVGGRDAGQASAISSSLGSVGWVT
jgi:hypothetical protein